ncbi:MAG TPA: sigma-70 family RNA polymerase sigma factor [Terracidiphilus sp.]|nr:sigma-70 family RNA polymerase sigma factor [Terracidiphilus sp.]
MTTGEDAEFTALVQRQSRFVFRVAYAVLLNSYDAEDAVQETFLKLYRNGGWQGVENERAFLARVAWRIAVDRRARPVMSPVCNVDLGGEITVADTPSCEPGPEQVLLVANQHAVIHSMIDALPEELRVPLVLSANDELNSREIGKVLGVPEGTVRTRLQRARQLLRQKLGALEKISPDARAEEAPYA